MPPLESVYKSKNRFAVFTPRSGSVQRSAPRIGELASRILGRLVRKSSPVYYSVVIFQNFIRTPITVSVYVFIGGVPWMLA